MVTLKKSKGLIIPDIICINLAVILSFYVIYEGNIPQNIKDNFFMLCSIFTLASVAVYYFLQLYNSLWKYASIDEFIKVVVASICAPLVVYLCLLFLDFRVHVGTFFLYSFFSMLLIGTNRVSYRIFKRIRTAYANDVKDYRRVMIIGAGEAGAMVIKELKNRPEMGLKPVVVIDDDKAKHNSKILGVPVVGGRESIQRIAKQHRIDEIIVAIPSAPKREIREIFNECKKTACKLKILPGVYELIDGKVTINNIRDVQIEDLLGREPIKVDLEEISQYLKGQVVLVTGGGGSIGSELCRQVAKFEPKQLLILDIYENNAYMLHQELARHYPQLDQRVLIASIRDRARMEAIFDKYRPDVVFHAAAHKHVPLMESNPTEAIKNNVFGTLNVAECADKYGTKRFVLISTDKAVNPTNIMGATKRIAEMIIQALNAHSKTEFVAVRFGNVLGSAGSVLPLFKKQIEEGGPVTVTHPEIKRYFMTIPEAVQLVIQAGAMAKGGEIFVLDMGEPVKIVDLARDLIRLSGLEPDVDIKIEFTGLRPGEKLYEELLMAEEGLTATKHEKIFICKPVFTDLSVLKRELENLKHIIMGSDADFVECIEKLVPTYKPLEKTNSLRIVSG
nr:MAG: nucleoside-diphosphate sugar epimerase [Caldicoprobacter oshimai]